MAPRDIQGILIGYYLLLDNTRFGLFENQTIYQNQTNTTGSFRQLVVSNLTYFSSYKVSMQAFTIVGPNTQSNILAINTLKSGEY